MSYYGTMKVNPLKNRLIVLAASKSRVAGFVAISSSVLALGASVAKAQTTVLYSDSFNQTIAAGSMYGAQTSGEVAGTDYGTATWAAGTTFSESGGSLNVTTPSASNNVGPSAFLYMPQSYFNFYGAGTTVTIQVSLPALPTSTISNNDWLALGFTQNYSGLTTSDPSQNGSGINAGPWMFVRTATAAAGPGQVDYTGGLGTAGITASSTSANLTGTNVFAIQVNETYGTANFYLNGTQIGGLTGQGSTIAGINFLVLADHGDSGSFQNLLVTASAAPEPFSAGLLASGFVLIGGMATRKFSRW